MVESCPHSLYFFRGDVEHFDFIEDFQGNKTAEELTEHPNPLLIADNEGHCYRASEPFTTTEDYVEGPGVSVDVDSYICVVRFYLYNAVTPVGTENPSTLRWYELVNTEYVISTDTTVDPNKTYYAQEVTYKFDNYGDSAVNTFRDWHIVPLGRPVVAPPQQKLQIIDVPGSNGVLDLSNSLTRYPVFQNRTGSMKFAVLNDVPHTDWITTYTKIMKFLQGTNVKMIMEDDPKYYYEGRVWVDNWDSRSDGTWSELELAYDLFPYRKSINTSIDEWLWDPFNFETDMITSTTFNSIRIDSDDWDEHDFTGLIDMMPVMPEFIVDTDDNQPMAAQLFNSDLGVNWRDYSLPEGPPVSFYNLIFCEMTKQSVVKMRFKGHGTVTIKFRSGRL